jgi:hypothetical protein
VGELVLFFFDFRPQYRQGPADEILRGTIAGEPNTEMELRKKETQWQKNRLYLKSKRVF